MSPSVGARLDRAELGSGELSNADDTVRRRDLDQIATYHCVHVMVAEH